MSATGNITGVILAGGSGLRIRSVTDVPKPVAPAQARPFLYYLLSALKEGGIGRVIICAGYRAEMVVEEARACNPGLELIFSVEERPLGTGGALRLASGRLESEQALVLNGDSYCDFDLGAFVEFHRQHPGHASILATEVEDARRYGQLVFGEDGKVTSFEEKGSTGGSGWINAGVYLIPSVKLRELPDVVPLSLEKEVFPEWLKEGIFAFPVRAPFLDIGTPESYSEKDDFIQSVKERRQKRKAVKKL